MSDGSDALIVQSSALVNASPIVYDDTADESADDSANAAFRDEIYSLIRYISDPEHPHTLEQLRVVSVGGVKVGEDERTVDITLIPTVKHCSLTLVIGLSVRAAILREYANVKIKFAIPNDKHNAAAETAKQLNDKERCAAAMEVAAINDTVRRLIDTRHSYD